MLPIRVLIPIILTGIFILYVLYLAFVKKNLKSKLRTEILPGVLFIGLWAGIYFMWLK
jgi:hypothetical protein